MQISLKDVENASVAGSMTALTMATMARLLGVELFGLAEYIHHHYAVARARINRERVRVATHVKHIARAKKGIPYV